MAITEQIVFNFNKTELYLSADLSKEKRNRKALRMIGEGGVDFEAVAKKLGISTATVYSIVKNKDKVTITGKFND